MALLEELHAFLHAQALLGLERGELTLFVDEFEDVAGLDAEQFDEILGRVDPTRDLAGLVLVEDGDEPLLGVQVLRSGAAEMEHIIRAQVDVVTAAVQDEDLVRSDMADSAKLRLGDLVDAPLVPVLVQGEAEDSVAPKGAECLGARSAEIHRLVEAHRPRAMSHQLDQDEVAGRVETALLQDAIALRRRIGERDPDVIDRCAIAAVRVGAARRFVDVIVAAVAASGCSFHLGSSKRPLRGWDA